MWYYIVAHGMILGYCLMAIGGLVAIFSANRLGISGSVVIGFCLFFVGMEISGIPSLNNVLTFKNTGPAVTVKPISVSSDEKGGYEVLYPLNGVVQNADVESVSVNPKISEAQVTIQYQTNKNGDSRYIVTKVQEPKGGSIRAARQEPSPVS